MTLKDYHKKKDYLVCIDSDGCAVDSMTIKHIKAFGKALIEVFELSEYEKIVSKEWNKINLYSLTRGINRFKGLNKILHFVNDNLVEIKELDKFDSFINTTKAYSNKALENYMESNSSKILEKCLKWSNLTNKYIKEINPCEIKDFNNVLESIQYMHKFADIVVVSSANLDAILNEWTRLNLIENVDCICSQNDGTKSYCINCLLNQGYSENNVIMFGDSPLDLESAKENNVHFYPILCKYEELSWKKSKYYFDNFVKKNYQTYEKKLIDEFINNLS